MKTELSLVVMAGVVLSLFLIVGELAAVRKRVKSIHAYLRALHHAGKFLRMIATIAAIGAFFLIQPFIIAFLVALVMDGLNPDFSDQVVRQILDIL